MPKSATVPVLSTSYYQPSDAQRVADKVNMEVNDEILLKCAIEATKKARQVVATRQARYWQLMGYVGRHWLRTRGMSIPELILA